MYLFKNPRWINTELLKYRTLDEVPQHYLDEVRQRLKQVTSADPLVTIIIAAWNEEVNVIRCLDTLTRNVTDIPFDILVVNNNSTDRTQEVLDRLEVNSLFQPIQGCGPARELGQRNAKGKYILIADADCLYPKRWIDIMAKSLIKEGVVFVYGLFCFMGNPKHPRWQFALYESLRNIMVRIRHIQRPYLNAFGISMGYIKELGIKEGYITRNVRGDDGRLCFDIMKHGKVVMVKDVASRVWTGTRTLERDESFSGSIVKRILREFARVDFYFTKPKPHDTKTSENTDYTIDESINIIKQKYNPLKYVRGKKPESKDTE